LFSWPPISKITLTSIKQIDNLKVGGEGGGKTATFNTAGCYQKIKE
jgi:hypothetical protein